MEENWNPFGPNFSKPQKFFRKNPEMEEKPKKMAIFKIQVNWSQTESNRVKLSQIESNRVKSSQTESKRVKMSQSESIWVKTIQNDSRIFDPNLNQIVSPFLDIFFKELLWFGIWVQKGFQFSSISGFFLKELLWFGDFRFLGF